MTYYQSNFSCDIFWDSNIGSLLSRWFCWSQQVTFWVHWWNQIHIHLLMSIVFIGPSNSKVSHSSIRWCSLQCGCWSISFLPRESACVFYVYLALTYLYETTATFWTLWDWHLHLHRQIADWTNLQRIYWKATNILSSVFLSSIKIVTMCWLSRFLSRKRIVLSSHQCRSNTTITRSLVWHIEI